MQGGPGDKFRVNPLAEARSKVRSTVVAAAQTAQLPRSPPPHTHLLHPRRAIVEHYCLGARADTAVGRDLLQNLAGCDCVQPLRVIGHAAGNVRPGCPIIIGQLVVLCTKHGMQCQSAVSLPPHEKTQVVHLWPEATKMGGSAAGQPRHSQLQRSDNEARQLPGAGPSPLEAISGTQASPVAHQQSPPRRCCRWQPGTLF